MNPKLIALLIRSNALMIEALKMADANAQERDGGPYVHETSEFNNLVADCEVLAKEAEEMVDTTQTEIQIDGGMGIRVESLQDAAKEGAERAFAQLNKGVHPMIPMSPAHQIEAQPLDLKHVQIGRVYLGKSENTGQQYTAAIKEIDTQMGPGGKCYFFLTSMLKIEDRELTPFERGLPEAAFVKEFLRWEK